MSALSAGMIDASLAALQRANGDVKTRRQILAQACPAILNHPSVGAQLISQMCQTEEDSEAFEHLVNLLEGTLNEARIACENYKKKGDKFVAAITQAIAQADQEKMLTPSLRLVLAQAWSQSGLPIHQADILQMHALDYVLTQDLARSTDPEVLTKMLETMFENLVRQTSADTSALYQALSASLPAMPPKLRAEMVAWTINHKKPEIAQLSCYWLLDPIQSLRATAAHALEDRLRSRTLSADIYRKLVVLRSWMPDDAARAQLDKVLRSSIRAGLSSKEPATPWSITRILAALPDGSGSQSITVSLRAGENYWAGIILIKDGHGIKDVHSIPCNSAEEQDALIDGLSDELNAILVPVDWLERTLAIALADGLARDKPPAAELVELVDLCGFFELRPLRVDVAQMIEALPAAAHIRALPARLKSHLVNESDTWWQIHVTLQSWFEDSDVVHDLLASQKSPTAVENVLWKWLETRRSFWTQLVARTADLLSAAEHPDLESFTATALALHEGRSLKKIPFMRDVHMHTIQAWVFETEETGSPLDFDDLELFSGAPEPERAGEFEQILKYATISAHWVEGYLTAVVVAPKKISPNQWLPEILGGAIDALEPDILRRFIDLIMLRTQAITQRAASDRATNEVLAHLEEEDLQDWAEGFCHAFELFHTSWPAASLGPDDRTVLTLIANVRINGLDSSDQKLVAQWLMARTARKNRLVL